MHSARSDFSSWIPFPYPFSSLVLLMMLMLIFFPFCVTELNDEGCDAAAVFEKEEAASCLPRREAGRDDLHAWLLLTLPPPLVSTRKGDFMILEVGVIPLLFVLELTFSLILSKMAAIAIAEVEVDSE